MGDLLLLFGEFCPGFRLVFWSFTRGAKFAAGPLRPRSSAEGVEGVPRGAEWCSRLGSLASTAQPGPILQEQPSTIERPAADDGVQPGVKLRLCSVVVG